jgi:S1-C subfamily serine protease
VLGRCTFCGFDPAAEARAAAPAEAAPAPQDPGAPSAQSVPPQPGAPRATLPPAAAARAEAAAAPKTAKVKKSPAESQQQMLVVLLCIVAVLVVGVGFLVVQMSSLNGKVSDAKDEAANVSNRLGAVEGQMKVLQDDDHALHDQLDAQAAADPAVVAGRVQPSVWTIGTPQDLGSGWVAQSDGTTSNFITNYHVVAQQWESGDHSVDVYQDSNGTHLPGTITQVSPDIDLAVINVKGALPVLKQSSEAARSGQSVLVVGSPLGLGGSVSTGSVSALRELDGVNYIQFSAPVSPGNSGGPVVDGTGEVIGVTVAKAESAGAEGIGFAIPVNQVCVQLKVC